ncbi:hypothetical protein ACK3YN_14375, partial [Aeromonas caviae]
THDEPFFMAPDDKHDLISGTCSHLPKLALEFDLTDPMVQRTMGDEMWEGEVEQSGTITIKGTWR